MPARSFRLPILLRDGVQLREASISRVLGSSSVRSVKSSSMRRVTTSRSCVARWSQSWGVGACPAGKAIRDCHYTGSIQLTVRAMVVGVGCPFESSAGSYRKRLVINRQVASSRVSDLEETIGRQLDATP